MMMPATAPVSSSDGPFVVQSSVIASYTGRASSASGPDCVSMRPSPSTRSGARNAGAHRQEAALRHADEERLLDAEMRQQRERVVGRIPVGELAVRLGLPEAALVPGDAPELTRERRTCGSNISWSIKNPWLKITAGPSPPESSK